MDDKKIEGLASFPLFSAVEIPGAKKGGKV